jgi:hypothetical protein
LQVTRGEESAQLVERHRSRRPPKDARERERRSPAFGPPSRRATTSRSSPTRGAAPSSNDGSGHPVATAIHRRAQATSRTGRNPPLRVASKATRPSTSPSTPVLVRLSRPVLGSGRARRPCRPVASTPAACAERRAITLPSAITPALGMLAAAAPCGSANCATRTGPRARSRASEALEPPTAVGYTSCGAHGPTRAGNSGSMVGCFQRSETNATWNSSAAIPSSA